MDWDYRRDQLARERGYANYFFAHDSVRQEIDEQIQKEKDEQS